MRSTSVVAVLCLSLASAALAGAPQLPYQGRLDRDGQPQTGQFDFRFRIYGQPSGGGVLWTGDHSNVAVVGGAFSVKLGSTAPLDDSLLASSQLYLEISVKRPSDGTYTTLKGRQQLLHVPYAATSSGDFRVNGSSIVGQSTGGSSLVTDGGTALTVVGPNTNGGATGTLRMISPAGTTTMDGRNIEANGPLNLNPINKNTVTVGGPLNVGGVITAPNAWRLVLYQGLYTSGFSFPIPSGGRQYKIVVTGQLSANGSDARMLFRVNGATSGYRSFVVFDGDASGGEWESTGFYVGRTVFGRTCEFSADLTLFAGGTYRATSHLIGQAMTDDTPVGGAAGGAYGFNRIAGWAPNVGSVTSVQLATTNGGVINGMISVYMIGG